MPGEYLEHQRYVAGAGKFKVVGGSGSVGSLVWLVVKASRSLKTSCVLRTELVEGNAHVSPPALTSSPQSHVHGSSCPSPPKRTNRRELLCSPSHATPDVCME